MIKKITDLRQGPDSTCTIEYRRIVKHKGRIMENKEVGRHLHIVVVQTIIGVLKRTLEQA